MQGTAEFHHQIADARLPQADPVFHHATALDAAVDVLDPSSAIVQGLVRQELLLSLTRDVRGTSYQKKAG